jgi:hypothetical protein
MLWTDASAIQSHGGRSQTAPGPEPLSAEESAVQGGLGILWGHPGEEAAQGYGGHPSPPE